MRCCVDLTGHLFYVDFEPSLISGSEAPCATDKLEVRLAVVWDVVIYDCVHALDIDTLVDFQSISSEIMEM